jgi:uncharacterized damage-inducible protein DinB
MQILLNSLKSLLDQLDRFLEDLPLEVYTKTSVRVPNGTIGKHVRHTLAHYSKLIHPGTRGQITNRSGLVISYDKRNRNTLEETEITQARKLISEIKLVLLAFTGDECSANVTIEAMLTKEGNQASFTSTVGRELWFIAHHAIHHHAMIKVIAEEWGVKVTSDFGLAPSTANSQS